MANRRSSITAELKLSGAQGFKRELVEAGNSANKLGKQLQAIKPITFDGGANQAKRSFAMIEEHQRAHHRVLLRQHQATQARMAAAGGGGSATRRGFGGASGNMAQAYNFVQDAAQGGIRGVANNIPWLIDAIASSPKVGALMAGIAGVAAVGAGYFAQNEISKAYNKHGEGPMQARKVNVLGEMKSKEITYNQSQAEIEAGLSGQQQTDDMLTRLGLQQRGNALAKEAADRDTEMANLQYTDRKEAIAAQTDEVKVTRELAELEITTMREAVALAEQKAREEAKAAANAKRASEAALSAANAEIELITNGNRRQGTDMSPQERIRLAGLMGSMGGLQATDAAATGRNNAAISGLGDVAGAKDRLALEEKIINRRTEARTKEIEEQRQAAYDLEYQKFRSMKRDADEGVKAVKLQQAEQEKARQTIRDQIKTEEDMAGMSPRKRAKAEEEEKRKARIESLKKEGFTSAEAGSIAAREEKLAKPRGNRIRGAGYGGEDRAFGGLGSETYGGLDDLAAMQPNRQERKTIRGAGAKPKEQNADKPETGWQMLIKAMQNVEKAVRDGAPPRSERAKPQTTASR